MWERCGNVIIASVLEVVAVERCNLSCRACSHLSPVAPKKYAKPDEVRTALRVLSSAFRVKVVKLMGGEPQLHPNLPAVVASIRESAPSAEVHLITNGHLMSRVALSDLEGIDQITLSIYPSAPIRRSDDDALRRVERLGMRVVRQFIDRFNESYCEQPHPDRNTTARVYRSCKIAHDWNCFTLRGGCFFKCPQAYALTTVLGATACGWLSENGIDLADPTLADPAVLAEVLHSYLASEEPLPACRHCLGSSGRVIPHEQVPRRSWRSAQTGLSSRLLAPVECEVGE